MEAIELQPLSVRLDAKTSRQELDAALRSTRVVRRLFPSIRSMRHRAQARRA